MTASSAVVLGNLAYLIGAVVLAVIGGLIVWLRHRSPQSMYAHVESFHRGLQALAPDAEHAGAVRTAPPKASGGLRIEPKRVSESDHAAPDEIDPAEVDPAEVDPAAHRSNGTTRRAGAEVDPAHRSDGSTRRAGAETG